MYLDLKLLFRLETNLLRSEFGGEHISLAEDFPLILFSPQLLTVSNHKGLHHQDQNNMRCT